MRSCLALWLAHGDEASVSAAKASAANHGAVPVDTFCWRRIVLLHLDLRSRHPCPKRTARATGGLGWAKSLAAWPEMRSVRKRSPVGPGTGFAHAVGTARCLGDA